MQLELIIVAYEQIKQGAESHTYINKISLELKIMI